MGKGTRKAEIRRRRHRRQKRKKLKKRGLLTSGQSGRPST